MSDVDVEKVIREYLPKIIHLSLGTSVDNKPWVCEVHYSYDDDLNFYFRSLKSRRHSQEIAKNSNVAGNIVIQVSLGESPVGVYFEGKAELLSDVNESHPAFRTYSSRLCTGTEIIEEAKKEDGHQFYKIIVESFYVFGRFGELSGQKYHLPWRKVN